MGCLQEGILGGGEQCASGVLETFVTKAFGLLQHFAASRSLGAQLL
jgi:hypothetical protein